MSSKQISIHVIMLLSVFSPLDCSNKKVEPVEEPAEENGVFTVQFVEQMVEDNLLSGD